MRGAYRGGRRIMSPQRVAHDVLFQQGSIILRLRAPRATLLSMAYYYTQTIEMTPAGDVLPRPTQLGWAAKIGIGAALVALMAAVTSVAALFLWLASILLPVALVAGAVAYIAFRLQLWRMRS